MPNESLAPPHMDSLRDRVIAWLAANGINANRIPTDPHMTLVGDQLTTDEKVQNERGRDQFDPGNDMRVARHTVTYTVTVPPPPDVAEWLLPRCPECGR